MDMKPTIVDISSSQPHFDPVAAKADGIVGAIVKIGEGGTFLSPGWLDRLDLCNDPLLLGAYHYARPGRPIEHDAGVESAWLQLHMAQARRDRGIDFEIIPSLDLEDGAKGDNGDLEDEELVMWSASYVDQTKAAGAWPNVALYANKSYIRKLNRGAKKLGSDLGLGRCPLWIAGSTPVVPQGIWRTAALWQIGSEPRDWCGGDDVDLNVAMDLSAILVPVQRRSIQSRIDAARMRLSAWLRGR